MKLVKWVLVQIWNNYHLLEIILSGIIKSVYYHWTFWFDFVWFYGIPTIAGYLKQNPVFTHILKYDFTYIL